ncbi:MAG: elongation factor P [Erysipelothrix sp.]|nr:elongation factor P [Erysipelothrix sp.]
MILINDLRAGMTFELDNDLFLVMDKTNNKTARSQMSIKTKVRNMRTGSITEQSWTSGDKVKKAHIDKKEMQYLYDDGVNLVFMDIETYEQIEIPKERLEWEMKFLKESDTTEIVMYQTEVMGINLPDKIALKIVETEPAVKGDTATSASKAAILETGLEIRVPLFISVNEIVLVTTEDGKYSSRA